MAYHKIPAATLVALTIVVVAMTSRTAQAAAEGVSGEVVSADGKPVGGAEVIVATPDQPAWVNLTPAERRKYEDNPAVTTKTDDAGRFSLASAPKDAGLLVIHHPAHGYAEVDPASVAGGEKVKLEPWGRLEGTFRIGASAAPAGTEVRLGNFGWSTHAARPFYGYATKTDAQGRYVLDRVPAGLAKVDIKASKAGATLNRYTWAEPGKPTRFDIGGAGRPVVGKLVLAGNLDVKNLSNPAAREDSLNSASYLRADVPWVAEPRIEGEMTDQERENRARAWRRTPEARALFEHEYRCELRFRSGDGSFRFDDVPPGKYQFRVLLYRMDRKNTQVADRKADFVVPETPACPTDEPLDLGNIELGNEGL